MTADDADERVLSVEDTTAAASQPRRGLPSRAIAYIVAVCALAVVAVVVLGRSDAITSSDLQVAAILAVAAAFAQLFVVVTPLNQSYHLTPGIILAAALLLPPELVAVVVICQHVPEWIKMRYAWFIQTFNVANFVVSALTAAELFRRLTDAATPRFDSELVFAVAAILAAIVFVAVQHLLLSFILLLARGHSFAQSGLFSFSSLSMDIVLALTGVVVAELWASNKWLVVLALSPLFLVHRALALPKLEAAARQDAKTELYNARHLAEALEGAVDRAQRLEQPVSLLVADLDLLRDINNRFGHLAGDAILADVARVLRENVRPGDVAARFGGEEFCVLLLDTSSAEAVEIAERIRREVEASRVEVDTTSEALHATVSIGVATYPDHAGSARELLHVADVAAYQAKAHGRNQVVAYGAARTEIPVRNDSPGAHDDEAIETPSSAPVFGVDRGLERRLPAPPPMPSHLAPARSVGVFAVVVALLGALVGILAMYIGPREDFLAIWLLALAVAIAHAVTAESVDRGTISVSAVGSLAAVAMFGSSAALPAAVAVCVAELIARRQQSMQQVAFNFGALTVSGLAAALIFEFEPDIAQALDVASGTPWLFVGLAPIAGAAYFVVNIGFLSTIIALETRENWLSLLRSRFGWLFGYYTLYGVVAAMLAIAYDHEGALGLLVFAAPLLLVRKAQRDYIKHSESSATKLRAAAVTIEQQNETLRQANTLLRQRATAAMESLAAAIDARDSDTAGHSRRVQHIATQIARELELDEADVEAVSFAALFHDVGKLGVPDTVLLKTGPLDDDDWGTIRRHPDEGARIIGHLGFLSESIPAIRHHHERFDGSGYPQGLNGEGIPVGARILHVADALDSMLSSRPYRAALPIDFALTELEHGSGKQFCPECVSALERVIAAGGLRRTLVEISLRASESAEFEPNAADDALLRAVGAPPSNVSV